MDFPLLLRHVSPATIDTCVWCSNFSLGSSLIISSSFLCFCFLVKNDSLGNFDFIRQGHLDYPSDFEGLPKNDNAIDNSIVL